MQGQNRVFPVQYFHTEKNLFSIVFLGDENRFFPVRNTTQGKPCFHYRDGFAVQENILTINSMH